MADIEKELKAIQEAVYGEEVRNAIHDAIQTCYDDGKAGAIDLVARGQIATKADKSELENVCGSDAYSNDKSYTVNDTCIHNNKLWKCIVACSGIEPPNATYWEEYTITGAISELNSTMDDISSTMDDISSTMDDISSTMDDISSTISTVTTINIANAGNGSGQINCVKLGKIATATMEWTPSATTVGHNLLIAYGFPKPERQLFLGLTTNGGNCYTTILNTNGEMYTYYPSFTSQQRVDFTFTYICK